MKSPKVAFNTWFETIHVRFPSLQRFVAEVSTLVAERIFHFDEHCGHKDLLLSFHKVAGSVM